MPTTRRRPSGPPKKRVGPKQSKLPPGICKFPDCGRKSFARELCQTHHRQLITTGKLKPIRPYRQRTAGTVKFSGLRLTSGCAAAIEAHAEKRGLSHGAALADILERWHADSEK